jgi:hypothetical protein
MTKEYDFFISYSSQDKKYILRLAEDLKKKDSEVWLDLWEMGPGGQITR